MLETKLNRHLRWLCAAPAIALAACAHSPAYDPQDPLEKINRPVFAFNMKADQYVLRPVAKTYADVVPQPARESVHNFFVNLSYPSTIANDLLQGKLVQGGRDGLRFVMNSTIGLAGFIDVARTQGLTRNDEDLGQTFGRWGFGPGWYLMLPLLGPSDNRDLLGRVGDTWTSVPTYVDSVTLSDRIALAGGTAIDQRARLLGTDQMLEQQLDQYVFVRTAYLEYRENAVYDGHPPQETFDASDADLPDEATAPMAPAAR